MATLEDEIKDLKEKNNELAQKVQYWKMTAAERENEKLNLMKEMNELRLKLSRLRNSSGFELQKLDVALQQASEKAISHLVKASTEIARGMEITKAYIHERQELDAQSPRWSTLGGTPSTEKKEKVHRVPPMMGGRSIQPVVALSRTMLNTSNPRSGSRSPNQNRSITERAVPMHMLQDVYIPLTRIDVTDMQNNNMETDAEVNNADDSTEDLGLDDSQERLEESAQMSEDDDDDEYSRRRLHALSEEDSEVENTSPRLTLHMDNPLEGPSWLLDSPPDSRSRNQKRGGNLEPDSTTELDKTPNTPFQKTDDAQKEGSSSSSSLSVRVSCEFSPTVRRRKRTSSPPLATPRHLHYSPRPASSRKNSVSGRVLKVLVAKMCLDGEGGAEGDSSPPKRARSPPRDSLLSFDAPSPNGATDARVIVSETRTHSIDNETAESSYILNRRESRESRARHNSQETRENVRERPSVDENVRSRPNQKDRSNTEESTRSRTNANRSNTEDNVKNRKKKERPSDRENSQERPSTEPVEENVRSKRPNNSQNSRMFSQDRDSVQRSRVGSHDSRDSDSGSGGAGDSISEGRTRRPRKMITYKEKPLNRKLRR